MKFRKARILALAAICFALVNYAFADNSILFSMLPDNGKHEYITMDTLKKGHDLVLFWRSDCAPCLLELGLLPEITRQFPDLKILLIALQDKASAQKHMPANLPANIEKFVAISDAREVLKAFGNEKMALPFSVALRKDGSICDKNYGILAVGKINNWIKTCSISHK